MQLSASDVLNHGLALSPEEREIIAHRLWESLPEPEVEDQNLPEILADVKMRNAELDCGADVGRDHDDVMAAARRALQCE